MRRAGVNPRLFLCTNQTHLTALYRGRFLLSYGKRRTRTGAGIPAALNAGPSSSVLFNVKQGRDRMYEELELIRMGVPYSEALSIVHYCRKDGSLQDTMEAIRQDYRLRNRPVPSER